MSPAAPAPVASTQAPKPAAATGEAAWSIVKQEPQQGNFGKPKADPTPEDRSYAEWFAWAKRGGATAAACHAAAQGAVRSLAAGSDVPTAAQIAAQSMAVSPGHIDPDLGQYCAWYSLANIDEGYDSARAHTFAEAAVKALDQGMDTAAAHQAGLAAIGLAAGPQAPLPPPKRAR